VSPRRNINTFSHYGTGVKVHAIERQPDGRVEFTDQIRVAIRRLFTEYHSFAWAAELSTARTSVAGLRQHLILFSMQDQGRDSRDALLTLQEICREASSAGVNISPVLREVADLSGSANKYGLGSPATCC